LGNVILLSSKKKKKKRKALPNSLDCVGS